MLNEHMSRGDRTELNKCTSRKNNKYQIYILIVEPKS
jgi:hypothetical protein